MRIRRFISWTIGTAATLLFVLFAAYFVWGNFLTDEFYREGMEESGEEKVIIYSMRDYFHGKEKSPKFTLEELRAKGILPEDSYRFIRSRSSAYYPFGPETSDHAVVLRLGPPFLGELFIKATLPQTLTARQTSSSGTDNVCARFTRG